MVSVLNRAVVTLLPLVPRPLVWKVSRRYIAGTSIEDALGLIESLNKNTMRGTIDILGEDSDRPQEAEEYRDLYLEAMKEIHRRGLDCNISIKLSQMGLRIDPELCRRITSELAAAALRHDNFVRIDMEDSSVTSETLHIYRELRKTLPVGAVLQSYLRRSLDDAKRLVEEGPTNLRICKGIYQEPSDRAFQDREEIRDSYRALLEFLITAGVERVGIATHDPPLIEFALELIRRHDVPKERYEFQMLLGVAETLRSRLTTAGHPLRVYVPFGEAWFAYSTRRLKENPQIAGHVLRNLFSRS